MSPPPLSPCKDGWMGTGTAPCPASCPGPCQGRFPPTLPSQRGSLRIRDPPPPCRVPSPPHRGSDRFGPMGWAGAGPPPACPRRSADGDLMCQIQKKKKKNKYLDSFFFFFFNYSCSLLTFKTGCARQGGQPQSQCCHPPPLLLHPVSPPDGITPCSLPGAVQKGFLQFPIKP